MVMGKEELRRQDKEKQSVERATISSDEDCCPDSLALLLRRLSGEEDLKVVRTLAFTADTSMTQVW